MSKQDPKSQLFERLEPEFRGEGFTLVRSRGAFERQRGEVSDMYKLDLLTSTAGTRIQPAIIMRFAALDRIYHKVSGAKPADQKFHAAISFAIWRVYGGREKYEFLLSGEPAVESVATQLITALHEVALPFFQAHSTVADVDRLYNTAPNARDSIMHQTDAWTRCAYATIAANLAGNAEYGALVDTYESFLKTYANGQHYEQYRTLLRLLEQEA